MINVEQHGGATGAQLNIKCDVLHSIAWIGIFKLSTVKKIEQLLWFSFKARHYIYVHLAVLCFSHKFLLANSKSTTCMNCCINWHFGNNLHQIFPIDANDYHPRLQKQELVLSVKLLVSFYTAVIIGFLSWIMNK